jgi:hypothetical protein
MEVKNIATIKLTTKKTDKKELVLINNYLNQFGYKTVTAYRGSLNIIKSIDRKAIIFC